MTEDASEILKSALALPADDQSAIARALLKSLDECLANQDVEAAWSEEIERRIQEIDSGKVQLIPYEEVRRRMAALL